MKPKKRFGCGTIVWIIIALLVLSVLVRAVGGRKTTKPIEEQTSENTENIAVADTKKEKSDPSSTVEQEVIESSQEEAAPTPGESSTDESSETPVANSTGVTPEFKETMDSYEAFFDEYIAFMEKYSKSDNQVSMMTDYLSYMQKYMDVMEKLEAIDEKELSDADALYYAQVQLRISEKLLSVSGS